MPSHQIWKEQSGQLQLPALEIFPAQIPARRALKKKVGAKKYAEMIAESGDVTAAVSETAAKLNYIDLIQKLRKLNEEKGEQDYGDL